LASDPAVTPFFAPVVRAGGPIPTPALDRVAQRGLLDNQFPTTALCSSTRAALLTGRNHHTCGMGNITEFATGYPGYTSIMPKSVGTIGNILVNNGDNTAWFGKHHLVPEWMQGQERAGNACLIPETHWRRPAWQTNLWAAA
jgi:arylsulfatase A-like enzyme